MQVFIIGTPLETAMALDRKRLNKMKRRLYSKDNEHYKQWAYLGESEVNWYFVDGEWRKYINGKRIE
jgi:hypothetical protein